ncbi:MAG TPA: serine/threonine-protein kinase, partial [Polyangiaceae bacterium]|nr:serine/threonine-protein kinase [Polyangiaceae bacterium]
SHAHANGVIHCDVRPSNVIVGRDGRVVLIDFGAAYAEAMPTSPEPLDVNAALAAPSYMSPEQILGETVDPRSDVFAMGVVLYELLSGRRPFEATDQRTLAHCVRHDEPKSLDRATTPRALSQIVARCLQKLPADRYASAKELCAALEEAFGNLSSSPRRQVITAALVRARIIDRPVYVDEDPADRPGDLMVTPSVMPALRLQLMMLALLVVGGVAIHFVFRSEIEAQATSGQGTLLLVPARAGSLLVVAQPWAHVLVDGLQVETTPFARPIPLSAGLHHVTLRHPNAPDERRTVQINPGERVLLDVDMQVRKPPKPESSVPAPLPSASTP